jgi:DinB family protein
MAKRSLQVPDQLERTPEILRLLMENLSEHDARWSPAPGRYSIAEVLEHLSHVEGHCYRLRVDRILAEDHPTVEPYDQDVLYASGQYSAQDPEDSFDHFEEQRETNLEFLRSLEESAAARAAVHPEAGEFTLLELLHDWAFHDLSHIRQVAELVRMRRNHPNMGALRRLYSVSL